ncbi:hypothetical protein BGX21_005724, partial [Mortierella sp. AD011]
MESPKKAIPKAQKRWLAKVKILCDDLADILQNGAENCIEKRVGIIMVLLSRLSSQEPPSESFQQLPPLKIQIQALEDGPSDLTQIAEDNDSIEDDFEDDDIEDEQVFEVGIT